MTHTPEFKELISKHLGKAGDGSVVKPYVTPTKHDKSLLVPIPRSYNREKSGIEVDFVGYEAWHAYEMSYLNSNGMPATGILKIVYDQNTPSMVESKSLKLYLNSFDLERFDSEQTVINIIEDDLSEALGGVVSVHFHRADAVEELNHIFKIAFTNVDNLGIACDEYNENSNILLTTDPLLTPQVLTFHTANLRSNCEITNQKDTGNCFIYMKGTDLPSIEMLTRYIISMRDSQHFHENVTEIVYNTLKSRYFITELAVINLYNRRGGIDIHSIRADSYETLDAIMFDYDDPSLLFYKTAQQ